MAFKVIIAGSRSFNDYELLKSKMDLLLCNKSDEIEIVCGAAKGADLLGKRYAEEKSYNIKMFPADWEKYGKGAGFRRNNEMAQYADALVAFWNGKSKGTKIMIDLALHYGLNVRRIIYDDKILSLP